MIFQLFITQKCNLKCKYCFEGEKEEKEMDFQNLPYVIRFMKNYVRNDFVIDKVIWVNFNGGEAFLRKDFIIKAVKEFRNQGINNFSISTNLTLYDSDFIEFLVEKNFTIQISIDGERKTHDKNRIDYENKGSFDIVWRNIVCLNKNYPSAKVLYSMVYTPETVKNLYKSIRFLTDNIFEPSIITSYNSNDLWKKRHLIIFIRQVKKIRKLYVKKIKDGDNIYLKSFSQYISDTLFKKKTSCGCCKDLIGIKPDGDVIACGAFLGNKDECKFKIGSIFENRLNESLVDELLKIKVNNQFCNNCLLKNRCDNDCIVCNYNSSGDISKPDYVCCEINKALIKESDKAIMQLRKNKNFYNIWGIK